MFVKVKESLKGTTFDTVEVVKDKAAETLNMFLEN